MTDIASTPPLAADHTTANATLLIAFACGAIVANLYTAQPLVGPIAETLGLSAHAAAFIVTVTQLGYCAGLVLVVPLADIVENRRLVVTMLAVCAGALALAAWAPAAAWFLLSMALMGVAASAAQILVPFAAHLAPDAIRGRVVGTVMSGLMLGIMLARPVASFVTSVAGWHMVFGLSAVVTAVLAVILGRRLPQRTPAPALTYVALLASLLTMLRTQPVLRQRSLYQACLFAAFSLFWTTAPLYLASPAFGLTQRGIALFALAGVAGAISAPFAGRLADSGHARAVTITAMVCAIASFVLARFAHGPGWLDIGVLVVAAIVLDASVSANMVVSQRAVFALPAEHRSRLNGLFLALLFIGGAVGSAAGGWAYASGGWPVAAGVGAVLPLLALCVLAARSFTRSSR